MTLVAFTDGWVERRREHLDEGLERLRVAASADLPIADLVQHVVDTLAPEGSDDDIAVLGPHWIQQSATSAPTQIAARAP